MTTTSSWLLVAIGVSAAANWWSRLRSHERLELVTKPLVTALVIAFAASVHPHDETARALTVAALGACLAGDVLLLKRVDQFIGGLSSFFLGHILFAVAAVELGLGHLAPAVMTVAFSVVVLAFFANRILRSARQRDPMLGNAVAVYFLVIAASATMVAATGSVWALAGGLLFMTSDTILGFDRFVRPVRWAPVAVMATYHAALLGLTVGLVGSGTLHLGGFHVL